MIGSRSCCIGTEAPSKGEGDELFESAADGLPAWLAVAFEVAAESGDGEEGVAERRGLGQGSAGDGA